MKKILPAMRDYYETEYYIFVHGWIPCGPSYTYIKNWRDSNWAAARWTNGMEAAHCGVTAPDKAVVCGHWHTSFGHCNYEGRCSEFGADADFSPYIALDACTALSHKVNCIVIDD